MGVGEGEWGEGGSGREGLREGRGNGALLAYQRYRKPFERLVDFCVARDHFDGNDPGGKKIL